MQVARGVPSPAFHVTAHPGMLPLTRPGRKPDSTLRRFRASLSLQGIQGGKSSLRTLIRLRFSKRRPVFWKQCSRDGRVGHPANGSSVLAVGAILKPAIQRKRYSETVLSAA